MNLQIEPRWVREEGGLRPFQRQTLEAIKGSAKLIEVEAPVGAGKSYIVRRLITDSDFAEKSIILTYPTTILMDAQVGALKREVQNMAVWPEEFVPKGYNIFNYSSASIIRYLAKKGEDCRLDRSELLDKVVKKLGFVSKHRCIVTSPDVLHLLINQRFYKGSNRLCNLLQGCIVCFDEFHLYYNLENFVKLVENLLKKIADKVVLLSATPILRDEFSKIEEMFSAQRIGFEESVGDSSDFCFNHQLDVEIHQFRYTDRNTVFEKLREFIPQTKKPVAVIFDSIFRLRHLKRRLQKEFGSQYRIIEWSGMEKERLSLDDNTILLGTSSIEVGIDVDFKTLITEASYWTSAIQRIGRVGRKSKGRVIIFTRRDFAPHLQNRKVFSRTDFEEEVLKGALREPQDRLISSEMFRGESFNFILFDEELKETHYYSDALFAMYEITELIDDWRALRMKEKMEILSDWRIPKKRVEEIMLYDRVFPFWGLVRGRLRNEYIEARPKREGDELYIVTDDGRFTFYGD